MELTNDEMVGAKVAIEQLLEEKLPSKIAWGLAKIVRKLQEHVSDFVIVRDKLFSEYKISMKEDGKRVVLESEIDNGLEKFSKEYNDLLDQVSEVVIDKVILPETFEVKASVLVPLEKFIEI